MTGGSASARKRQEVDMDQGSGAVYRTVGEINTEIRDICVPFIGSVLD